MKASVPGSTGELSLREIDLPLAVGLTDVRSAIDTVGVCGSNMHFMITSNSLRCSSSMRGDRSLRR